MTEPSELLVVETDIRALQKRAYATSKAHGFHDDGDTLRSRLHYWQARAERLGSLLTTEDQKELEFWESMYRRYLGNNIALLHSEASEAFEHLRDGREPDEVFFEAKADGTMKPDGHAVELADLAIRVLDTAEEHHIDLAAVMDMKMRFNEGRPFKHGRQF